MWRYDLAFLLCLALLLCAFIAACAALSGPRVVIEVPAGTKVEVIQR